MMAIDVVKVHNKNCYIKKSFFVNSKNWVTLSLPTSKLSSTFASNTIIGFHSL